tara:strand:- start:23 stop:232 length:210 start_codon:yes stop_codon:yes gene_type:complete
VDENDDDEDVDEDEDDENTVAAIILVLSMALAACLNCSINALTSWVRCAFDNTDITCSYVDASTFTLHS